MEQNYKDAINQLDLAAEKGDAEAQYKLGKILSETGAKYLASSIKQDYKEAIEYSPNIVELFKGISRKLFAKGKVKVGDIIEFGDYPFDEHGKVLPIEWRVLDVKDNKALLITKYGIDCKPYNEEYIEITWEDCTLRRWLNNEFYHMAFSAEEKEVIIEDLVKAEKNPEYDTHPGNDTNDKVFLLNIQEAYDYFSGDDDRECEPTGYVDENGRYTRGGRCSWWLRSSGKFTNNAALVISFGEVYENGNFVNYGNYAVRPALWVNLSAL